MSDRYSHPPAELRVPLLSTDSATHDRQRVARLMIEPVLDSPSCEAVSSAIPVADAIRGFYAVRGQAVPALLAIDATKTIEQEHYGDGLVKPRHLDQPPTADDARIVFGKLPVFQHICVIDEHVNTGSALQYAGLLCKAAGIPYISAIRGGWYMNVQKGTFDVRGVTSQHADFMFDVGRQVAAAVAATDHPVDTIRFTS